MIARLCLIITMNIMSLNPFHSKFTMKTVQPLYFETFKLERNTLTMIQNSHNVAYCNVDYVADKSVNELKLNLNISENIVDRFQSSDYVFGTYR